MLMPVCQTQKHTRVPMVQDRCLPEHILRKVVAASKPRTYVCLQAPGKVVAADARARHKPPEWPRPLAPFLKTQAHRNCLKTPTRGSGWCHNLPANVLHNCLVLVISRPCLLHASGLHGAPCTCATVRAPPPPPLRLVFSARACASLCLPTSVPRAMQCNR